VPLIFHIETATDVCSVCIAENGKLLGIEETNIKNSHASMLHVLTDKLLKRLGITYDQPDAFAVSMGPGSYTGLRIGVAASKGFCFALQKPLIAVNTLEAMTAHFISQTDTIPEALYCPMIDARRMEVYTTILSRNFEYLEPVSAAILDSNSFSSLIAKNSVYFFGDGAIKFSQIISHKNAIFSNKFSTSSAGLIAPALKAWNAGKFCDLAYFEPFYLKDFISGVK
jgi:tRNA threonylcarbamoyladenosine biosynthesis protein TsaB